MRKLNFLVVAVLVMFILAVNAAEEQINNTYNQSKGNSSHNISILELKENLVNESLNLNESNKIDNLSEDPYKNQSKKIIDNSSFPIVDNGPNIINNASNLNNSNNSTNNLTNSIINPNLSTINKTIQNESESIGDIDKIGEIIQNNIIDENNLIVNNIAQTVEFEDNNKEPGKALTASFGVSLTIVG